MSMATRPLTGPRRLILIQSGKYDYAELDLTQPFQLVGVNGLGKTALISTLQYLYLDSQADMRFGQHTTADSRKFYFRGETSFILFECETSVGTVMLGARGLGAAGGNELQRFAWTGTYDRSDFITPEGRPKAWDEVKVSLARRGLKILTESAELRGLLGAVDVETDASWGLVPLADASDYRRFRQTFQRLLQLRDIRQDDLKQLLADCAKLGPSQREIDLAKEFDKELSRIARDRTEVTTLRNAAPQVKEVRKLYDDEYVARAIAHASVKELTIRHAGYADSFKKHIDAITAVRNQALADYARLEKERQTLDQGRSAAERQAGVMEEKLNILAKEKGRFADFVRDVEEQARTNLGNEVTELKVRLSDLPKESVNVLKRQLEEKTARFKQCEKTAANLGKIYITWLRGRLPEDSVARLGALFDRSILDAIVDEQIMILDEQTLLRRLKSAAENCDARGYKDDVVEIEFAAGALAHANRIGKIEPLQEEMRELNRQTKRLARDIETLQNAQPWKERLKQAEIAYELQIKRLTDHARHQEELNNESSYKKQLEEWATKIADWVRQLAQNEAARTNATNEKDAAINRFNKLQEEDRLVREEARALPFAEGEETGPTPISNAFLKELPEALIDVFRITREKCAKAKTLNQQLTDKTSLLDKNFVTPSFRYDLGAPLQERLAQLESEIASLEERSLSIENRWTSVLVQARNSFHTILKSLEEVTKQARKLNGELAKVEFSSISQVRLDVVQHAAVVAEYERHAKDSTQPSLFDTADEADRKFTRFRELLERRPRLVLNDLFSLRCEVARKDGQKNFYDDFDQVESTGTTIVLKVTLNLLVLRDLLIPGKARIPYYLDEVHALDRQNFNNILQLSERLGFVGIYAAPTAAIGPRRFVHLVPNAKGKLVVTAAHQKDIVRAPEDAVEKTDE